MECHKICMLCTSPQICKVNYAQLHGVCASHLFDKSTISTCTHCGSTIPVLEFKACQVCKKENKDLSSSCCKALCQNCKSRNFCCPKCFKCEICFDNSQILQKFECGHILCSACLNGSSCKVCSGFKFDQVESIEVSQEKSVLSCMSDTESPLKLNESLAKSESFTSSGVNDEGSDSGDRFIVDVELCEPENLDLVTKGQDDEGKGGKGRSEYSLALVVLVVAAFAPFKAVSCVMNAFRKTRGS